MRRRQLAWCLTCMAAALGLTASAVADDALERWIDLLERFDRTPWEDARRNVPVARLLDELAERSGLPVVGDWTSLDRLGIDPRDGVSVPEGLATTGAALRAVAFQLADEFERPIIEAYADQIVLTTREAASAMRATDAYDVRDLLVEGDTLARMRTLEPPLPAPIDPPREAEPAAPADDEPADPTATPPTTPITLDRPEIDPSTPARPIPRTPGEELMMLIVEHVDPEAWLGLGGNRATIGERDGVLLVTAAPSTHRAIRSTLDRLRMTSPRGHAVEVFLVEGDRAAVERVAAGHRFRPEAFAAAVAEAGVTIAWRSASSMVVGRPLAIQAVADDVEIDLRLQSAYDEQVGRLVLDLAVITRAAADQRRVETSVLAPRRRGLVVTELAAAPGVTTGGHWRGLVIAVREDGHR